ncbi:MAG: hemerythrin domain-containing protein [Candidatus Binatia bacterium]
MVNIGERPASGFDDPMGLLGDCHRRIERFLTLLMTVTEQAHGDALTSEQRDALEVSLRYFREAAPKHTSDEEESLFPRLRAAGDVRVTAVLARVHTLEADHRAAVVDHGEVEKLVHRWLNDGRLTAGETRELAARLHELQALYRHHIAVEDGEIFPLARELLHPDDLAQIGAEMARRRGLDQRLGKATP